MHRLVLRLGYVKMLNTMRNTSAMALGMGLLAVTGPGALGQGFCPTHPGNPILLTPGTASCAHDALSGDTTITLNAASIIEWNELDVPAGSVLDFNFLASASNRSVINRITGTRTSSIDGSLFSNGRVILLSQGSRIALNGFIQTQGFLASTMDVDDVNALLQGQEASFGGNGESARLSVGGTVQANGGDVVLAGSTISIGGSALVVAPMGAVRIVSATQFTLANSGLERVTPGGDPNQGGTLNTGRVEGGTVEMKATREISNAGLIEAGGGAGRVFMRVGPGGKVINEGTGMINGILTVTGNFDEIGVRIDPDELDGAAAVKSAVSRFPALRAPGEKRGKSTVVVDTGTVAASVSSSRDRNRRGSTNTTVARRGLHSKSGFFGLRGGSTKKKTR